MQTIPFTRLVLAGLLFTTAPLTLCAQENPQPRRPLGGLPPERPQADGRFIQPGVQNPVLRVLTEAQVASFRQSLQGQRESLRAVEIKLAEARKELTLASISEKFDENLVRAKALVVAKLDAEMAVLRARAMSQIKPPLSADQIEKLKNPLSDGGDLRPRQLDAGTPSIRPQQRSTGRDENDLPTTTPAKP